mgnify:CR=1 FL=1
MDKNKKQPIPNNEDSHNQSMKEQAINKKTKDGREVNDQVKDKKEKHLPRDTA